MSDENILIELLEISQMIADDDDKEFILGRISNLADKIDKRQDKASDYIDKLLNEVK